ncbi:MAG: hypothetical protein QXV84_04190 [Conexivisphaerales archaeon]
MLHTVSIIVYKSAEYFAVIFSFNFISSSLAFLLWGYPVAVTVFGYLTFFETALLFIAGGIADFSESFSSINLRKLMGKKMEYSREKHKEAQKAGASLVLTGFWFMLISIAMLMLHIH